MKWFEARTIAELKDCGSFREVRREIQKAIGDKFQLRVRNWNNLLKAIENLRGLLTHDDRQEAIISDSDSTYFKSKADEIIFTLLELDGEPRLKMLNVNRSHYRDLKKARKWRNKLAQIIHPDKCKHPKATLATNELNKLFNNMKKR